MNKSTKLAPLLAFLLAASAVHAAQKPIYAKAEATQSQIDEDLLACSELAKTGKVRAADRYSGLDGGLVGDLVVGVLAAKYVRSQYTIICMRERGYAQIVLTDAEQASYSKLPESKRDAWLDRFYKSGIEGRTREALTPLEPPFPQRIGPYMVGPIEIEDGVKASGEPVGVGGVVLSGSARRAQTAIMKAPAIVGWIPGVVSANRLQAEAGAVFHQVRVAPSIDNDAAEDAVMWCGPATPQNGKVRIPVDVCIQSALKGYGFAIAQGPSWIAIPGAGPLVLPRNSRAVKIEGPVELELRAQDDLLVMPFTLEVSALTDRDITLVAKVSGNGETATVWTGTQKIDAGGQAVLPFWARTLVLRRQGNLVSATLETSPWPEGMPQN